MPNFPLNDNTMELMFNKETHTHTKIRIYYLLYIHIYICIYISYIGVHTNTRIHFFCVEYCIFASGFSGQQTMTFHISKQKGASWQWLVLLTSKAIHYFSNKDGQSFNTSNWGDKLCECTLRAVYLPFPSWQRWMRGRTWVCFVAVPTEKKNEQFSRVHMFGWEDQKK